MTKKPAIQEKPKELVKTKTHEELMSDIGELGTAYDSRYVLPKADEESKKLKKGDGFSPETFLYKAMTLFEFDKGILMATSVPDRYSVFALEFSRNLQKEYNCVSPSEKSLAEATALNYVRVLEAQNRINAYLGIGEVSDRGIRFLEVMSKELDRAQRHYLASLQALKELRSPFIKVNIRTDTAVVGQNQIVQANNRQNKSNNS